MSFNRPRSRHSKRGDSSKGLPHAIEPSYTGRSCATCAAKMGALLTLVLALILGYALSKPTRLDPHEKPKSQFGLQLAWPSDGPVRANGTDIVFVHGLGSNPDTTWQTSKLHEAETLSAESIGQNTNWVLDFLPDDLPPIVRNDVRIFFYNYDSYWERDAIESRLPIFADQLVDSIDRSCNSDMERSRGLVFVTHSYGGILLKQALVQAHHDNHHSYILQRTKSIIFLGAPHRGSSFAFLGSWIAWVLKHINGASSELLKNLDYDSDYLRDLHKAFYKISMDDWQIHNLWEQRPQPRIQLGFIRWGVFVVREQSATYEGRNVHNFPLPVDHAGLNKFGSRTEAYLAIISRLTKACIHSVTPVERHYVVPLKRTPTYVNRTELMADLDRKLQVHRKEAAISHAVVLHGLGGTGKSQAALNFAERHRDRYNPILWINAANEETTRASFYSCARELKLPTEFTPGQGRAVHDLNVQAVLQWLRDRTDDDDEWLVIIDDADDLSWDLNQLVPVGGKGSVIITSQDMQSRMLIPGACEHVDVGDMSQDEGASLILRRLGIDADVASQGIKDKCYDLAQELGHLALAIDLAGASISNDPERDPEKALDQYIADFRIHRDALLKSDKFKGLMPTHRTVWTVWDAAFIRITNGEDAQSKPDFLLSFLALFKADVIHEEVFRLASLGMVGVEIKSNSDAAIVLADLQGFLTTDKGSWDSFQYREARNILLRFGLLQQSSGQPDGSWPGVAMHKLVRWRVSQDRLASLRWLKIIFMVTACLQFENEQKPEFRRILVIELLEILEDVRSASYIMETYGEYALNLLAHTLYHEGWWEETEKLKMRVMENRKTQLGAEHPDTLRSMGNLAMTYWKQGRFIEAEKLQIQVTEKSRTQLGADHPDTITSKGNLASTYRKLGQWEEAEKLEIQVMEARQTQLGASHPYTLISIANLALIYWDQGRWEEAENLQVQVMEVRRTQLGADHPDSLTSMANLALTYWSQGRSTEAEKLQVQVMETRRTQLGAEHPDTLSSMGTLATTYREKGRWEEAEELLLQVTETRENRLGAEHPDSLSSRGNLALLYKKQGRFKEAEKLQIQVVEISKAQLGADHPDTLRGMGNLVATYWSQGFLAPAEELGSEVAEASKTKLGADHPDTLTAMGNLVWIYWGQNRWEEAEEVGIRVMESRKIKLGVNHPYTLLSMADLATIYRRWGRSEEAEKLEGQMVAIRKT